MTIKQQGGIFGRNPTFNDLTVEGTFTSSGNVGGGDATFDSLTVDTNTLYVDATNDAAIIGTTTWNTTYEPRFQIQDTAGDGTGGILVSSYKPSVTFFDFSGGTPAVHRIAADSGKLSFEIDTAQNGTFTEAFGVTSAGNIAMADGNGIDFSATSGTGTSELFDDYEEGTWTPTLTNMGSSTVSSAAYTKIGRTVHIIVAIASDGSITANSSRFTLPYTSARLSSGVATRGTSEGGFVEIQASTLCYFASTISTSGGVYVTATYEAA